MESFLLELSRTNPNAVLKDRTASARSYRGLVRTPDLLVVAQVLRPLCCRSPPVSFSAVSGRCRTGRSGTSRSMCSRCTLPLRVRAWADRSCAPPPSTRMPWSAWPNFRASNQRPSPATWPSTSTIRTINFEWPPSRASAHRISRSFVPHRYPRVLPRHGNTASLGPILQRPGADAGVHFRCA